jgi:hypothetical protein
MEYEATFGGCNCGCTPTKYRKLLSNDKQELVKALAHMYFNHRSRGGKPFGKCSFSPDREELEPCVIERANMLETFSRDIEEIKRIIRQHGYFIKNQNGAIKTLGIEMPEHVKVSQEQANESIRIAKGKLSIMVLDGNIYASVNEKLVTAWTNDWDDENVKYDYHFSSPFRMEDNPDLMEAI